MVSTFFEKLEQGLMTRSPVPSCGGREDSRNFRNCFSVGKFMVVSCILEKLEKGMMWREERYITREKC